MSDGESWTGHYSAFHRADAIRLTACEEKAKSTIEVHTFVVGNVDDISSCKATPEFYRFHLTPFGIFGIQGAALLLVLRPIPAAAFNAAVLGGSSARQCLSHLVTSHDATHFDE